MAEAGRTDGPAAPSRASPGAQRSNHAPVQEPRKVPNLADYQTVFTASKAGMEGVDKEHVKRVVWETSQGSAHFKNEQRKQAATDEKIQKLKARAQTLGAAGLAHHTHEMDKKVVSLEATRDLSRVWIHVDMDAFYAACEEQVDPKLKDVPMAVGGMGMITTANYHARKFGVRSAMPGFIAIKLCPQLVFVRPNFERYQQVSVITRRVFATYDPAYEAASLDEAYLDVTDYCTQHDMTPEQVATSIRQQVYEHTGGLTCSCGVAPNKMLAKVCSDINKPNGQYVLGTGRTEVVTFVAALPVRKVPGVGKVTEQMLCALGVTLCEHLYTHRGLLAALFQPASLEFFMAAALGIGSTRHPTRAGPNGVDRKGISCERTFKPIKAWQDLERTAQELVEHLCQDMASEGIQGSVITLKLKGTDFKLLRAQLPVELRLMGVRMSGLRKRPDCRTNGPPAPGTLQAFLKPIQQATNNLQPQEQPAESDNHNAAVLHHSPPPQSWNGTPCAATTDPFQDTTYTDDTHHSPGEATVCDTHALPGDTCVCLTEDWEGGVSQHGEGDGDRGCDVCVEAHDGMQRRQDSTYTHTHTEAPSCLGTRQRTPQHTEAFPGFSVSVQKGVCSEHTTQQGRLASTACANPAGPGAHRHAAGVSAAHTAVTRACEDARHTGHDRCSEPGSSTHAGAGADTHNVGLGPGAAAAHSGSGAHRAGRSGSAGSIASTWACLACTYSGNHTALLRCEMCDTWRGQREPLQAAVCVSERGAKGKRKGVKSDRVAGSGGSVRGTLDALVYKRRSVE